jgi:hypothetical protein
LMITAPPPMKTSMKTPMNSATSGRRVWRITSSCRSGWHCAKRRQYVRAATRHASG